MPESDKPFTKKDILLYWSLVAVGIFLFPHHVIQGANGVRLDVGWGFIFSNPKGDAAAVVDIPLLALMEAVAAAIAITAYRLAPKDEPKE